MFVFIRENVADHRKSLKTLMKTMSKPKNDGKLNVTQKIIFLLCKAIWA